jgi:cell wall-associated NlpC family hydrolase
VPGLVETGAAEHLAPGNGGVGAVDTQVGTQVSATGRRAVRLWAIRAVGIAAVTAVCLGVAPGVASATPVNPSDAQLNAAQQAQQNAAAQVGQVTAALARAQSAAANASAAANIALQDYEDKQAAYDEARATADAAAAASAKADADLQGGRDQVAAFARDSYMQGSTSAGALALMTSGGPAELLERAALLDAVGEHRVDVVAQLTVLEQQATVAEQAAQQAVGQADTLKAEAAVLLASAQQQEVASRGAAAALAQQQDQVQAQLQQAQSALSGLEGQRSAAETYAAQQAAAGYAAQQAAAAAAAQRPATTSTTRPSTSSGGSSSGGSSSGGPTALPAPVQTTTAGAPSGSAVQTAIAAARTQLGLPYSWGGGGSNGPSYGISPDTSVWGFDCSGLTQYAYAQAGIQIGGTSRDQWYRFRGQTVGRDNLQAGDLVFWASGSSYSSIYHVALYLGGGKVIQAPQSGDVVKISGMWFGGDYFGAVRPTS